MPGLIVVAILFQSVSHYQIETVTLEGEHMSTAFEKSMLKSIFGTETKGKKSNWKLKKFV